MTAAERQLIERCTAGLSTLSDAMTKLAVSVAHSNDSLQRLNESFEQWERDWLASQTEHVRAEYTRLRASGECMIEAMEQAERTH
jgi:uncharacterized coiled-coil protein SlyX